MTLPTATVTGGTSYTDDLGDNYILVDQTVNAGPVTITAAIGDNDTVVGGDGDMVVDASSGAVSSLDVSPGFGATTILGGSGTLFVEEDGGLNGPLTVQLGSGNATINGSGSGTSIAVGTGDIQINADGQISITGNDGVETISWMPAYGDVINITTNPVTHATTLLDTGTNVSVLLGGGQIIVDATAASGTISDFANLLGTEVINLGSADVSVTASLGSDSINAGVGNVTVDAGGNANPITVNGGAATLTFSAGPGAATVSGGATATIVTGGTGTIALAQHGYTMITAGDGAITVTADGSTLSVTGEDGTSASTNWTPSLGDTVTITTDLVSHATTLTNNHNSTTTVLAGGRATNYINGLIGGTVYDLPDQNVINLMGGSVTVIASQGTDTINGGPMPGSDITVDATGNINPVVVNSGMMGTMNFTGGDGPATVTGSYMGTTVTGGNGATVLNQHGASTIHAHVGTITVNADGTPLTVIGADGTSNGSWNFTLGDVVTISSVGAITTVSDPNGSLSYTLPDIIPPVVAIDPITQTLNASGAAAGLTISGTTDAENGQMVSVTLMDGLIPIGGPYLAAVAGGIWSLVVPSADVTGLVDGSYTVAADVEDAAGNQAIQASQLLTVDETAPVVMVNTIASDNVLNATEAAVGLTIGGTTDAEVGQTVTVTIVDGSSATVWSDTASVLAGGTWSLTVPSGDATVLADGDYTVSASVADVAGNLSSPASRPLTVDETAPTVTVNPITQPLNALGAMAGLTIGGTTDAEVGQTVTVTIVDGSSATVWSDTASVLAGGTWSLTVPSGDATALLDGSYIVTANVSDDAGNPAAQATQSLMVDETAPTITISGTSATTNQLVQLVSGTADLSTAGQIVTVWDNGAPVTTTIVQLNGTWSVPIPLMVEGAHNLTASVNDPAGNTGTSAAVTYTLDTTPPTVAIDPLDPVNAAATAAGFPITGTTNAEDDQTVTIQILDSASNPVGLPYQATVSGGNWSVTVPSGNATALLDGTYTVTASVTDVAGNPSSPASQPFTVDQTAPVVAIINPGGLTNQATQIVSGIADPLDVGRIVTVMEGGTALGVATVGGGGLWSTAVTLSGDGAHSLTATETDLAGNTGTSAAVTYTLDATAPAVTIFGTGGPTNQTAQVVGGTGEFGASVTVWDGITSVGSALVDLNGNWSTSVNLTSDGPHSLTATQTDTAGNTGTSGSSVDYTLDTAAATVAITSLGRLTNQAMQTVSGTVDPSEAGATVTVWDGTTALGTATAASDGRWSATVVLAGDGAHSLMASETDGAGNTGISNAVTYTLDTTPVASGVNGNPYAGAIGQQLAGLLGSLGDLSYFGPGQPIPDSSTGSPALLISSNDGSPVTVPGGVSVVRNQASGADVQGSGQANQVVVSSVGFTYHSNGGSGVVLADDAQAGGAAGNSNIVLARSGGGDFVISTGSGDDMVDAASGNVSVAAGGGQNMIWLGSGNALVTSSGADTVVSGTGAATVHATAGSEALVFGGASTLTFMGDSGAATVVGGTGSTNLVAGSGNAVFWGSENGGNTMYAGTGAATLVGGGSGNVIHAAGSADLLLVAGSGNSTLVGGSATGNNFYWGSQGDDVISADQGNDTIIGGPGHDTVQAGGGNALIFGGVDGTTFVAGSGTANIVSGNGGANTFAFINGQAGGTEIIWGFRGGTDHLSLQGYGANELANATAGAQGYGPGTQIGLSDGTKIIFGDLASLKAATLG